MRPISPISVAAGALRASRPQELKKQFRIHRDRPWPDERPQVEIRQGAVQQIIEGVRVHRDEPRPSILSMGHDPRLAATIAARLGASIGQVQVLHALHLDVQPPKRVAHDIRTVPATGELLPTPGIKPMHPQQRRKLPLANFSLLPRVHLLPPFRVFRVFSGSNPCPFVSICGCSPCDSSVS